MTSAESNELVLGGHALLVDTRAARPLALEAAVAAMAPATRGAITADLRCFLAWCKARRPVATAVPAEPETLVHYLHWLAKGSDTRAGAKPATLARRIASIARIHRILGFGEREPLPTQAGMVRDTLKGIRRKKRVRQRQAAPLRLGEAMQEGQAPPEGVTVNALLASCGSDIIGLRDAALISLAYDAGLRVSELVNITIDQINLRQRVRPRLVREVALSFVVRPKPREFKTERLQYSLAIVIQTLLTDLLGPLVQPFGDEVGTDVAQIGAEPVLAEPCREQP